MFFFILVSLFFCSRTFYGSPVTTKSIEINQSLKSTADLAVICFSKLSQYSPRFVFHTPVKLNTLHLIKRLHTYTSKPFFVTSPLRELISLCACCNPTVILTDSIQMLSLPGSLPCIPSQTYPVLNSLHLVPLLTLITFFLE